MKLLYLVAHQKISEGVVSFVAKVARQTQSSITLLFVAEDEQALESAENNLTRVQNALGDVLLTIKLTSGDPLEVVLEEMETQEYDMLLLNVRPRQRLVPSAFRFLSQRIINRSPIPVMLVREDNFKFEQILVCTGGQNISEPLVKLSAVLAGKAKLKATLLYVRGAVPSMYTGMGEIEETLEELLETDTPISKHLRQMAEVLAEHDVDAQLEIRNGDVVSAILKEAHEGDYDLIVVGASGRVNMASLLLGNITQQIINRAKSAVLVYKS